MPFSQFEKRQLQALLQKAILDCASGKRARPEKFSGQLAESRYGSFVTLKKKGQLCGCMGYTAGQNALGKDVTRNACRAGCADPRFQRICRQDLPETVIFLTLLGDLTLQSCNSRADFIASVKPKIHGVLLCSDNNRSTFLPAVWKHLPDPELFLSELLKKAGLTGNVWPIDLKVFFYQSLLELQIEAAVSDEDVLQP